MGTRGAYGFRIGGEDKVTYNHYDSYPDVLGSNVIDFIRGVPLHIIRQIAERIELVNEDIPPTPEQVERCLEFHNPGVSTGSPFEWYSLLRNSQGNLFYYADGLKFMIDNSSFLYDSLFCEWAYIINLDSGNLEVYRGFNFDKDAPGRYADCDPYKAGGGSNYYGVKLIAEIPIVDRIWAAKESEIAGLIQELEEAGRNE